MDAHMSVLFCHDHRFIVDEAGLVYSIGQYSAQIVARYEKIFGEMRIAGRLRAPPKDGVGRLNLLFSDRARFFALPNLSSVKALLFGDAGATQALEQAVAGADVVVVRLPSEIGLLAERIARRLNKPVIVEVVACAWDGLLSHGSLAASLYAPIAWWRMRRAVARNAHTLYVTQKFLQRRYPASGLTVCASNVQLPAADAQILERRLSFAAREKAGFTFGMIAALFHNEKRVDVAIRALADASRHRAGLRLEVVGSGDPAALKALASELGIADRVDFLGILPHGPKLFSWLDGVDVYVQTSFQEGLPRALIEALSRAAPALASEAGGTEELLAPEWRHGRGDVTRLARQMVRLCDSELQKRLAAENFARAREFAADVLDARRDAFWRQSLADFARRGNA
jgi:glycosyltransferase involved in cell wall biosynthesis